MKIIKKIRNGLSYNLAYLVASLKSIKTYPEDLSLNLDELLEKQRVIKVAIIDDAHFPWVDALQSRGFEVKQFSDYVKPITQSAQKQKTYDFASFDIILCDINDVGKTIYPGIEGIGVIDELRKKLPFHVIAAYTGNPGAINKKLRKSNTIDKIFVRDWEVDDFLLNFDDLASIFNRPQKRWEFIRNRLYFLDVGEQKVSMVRKSFVKNVLITQFLKKRFSYTTQEIRPLLGNQEIIENIAILAQYGGGLIRLGLMLTPFGVEN